MKRNKSFSLRGIPITLTLRIRIEIHIFYTETKKNCDGWIITVGNGICSSVQGKISLYKFIISLTV